MAIPKKIPCVSVTQPLGTFYIATLRAGELIASVDILRRGLDEEAQKNVQRELSGNRVEEISAYAQEPDAAFPTSIIVSAYPQYVRPSSDGQCLFFGAIPDEPNAPLTEANVGDLPADGKLGQVIDGQHRLMGLREAGAGNPNSKLYSFEIPVVFMMDLDDHDRAYVFSTINSKQTRVPTSYIYDLFGLSKYRSPKKTCHQVARTLNSKKGSPFYQSLKMLGKKNQPTETLTQGSFANYLLPLISRTPEADASALKDGKEILLDPRAIFRKYFIENRDETIVALLEMYFTAVRRVYPLAWENSEDYALKRTVGFAALMHALRHIWTADIVEAGKGKANQELFDAAVEKFAVRVPEARFRDIPSSGGAAIRLGKELAGIPLE